jgi:hypothetical protein
MDELIELHELILSATRFTAGTTITAKATLMNLSDGQIEITGTRFCAHDPNGKDHTFGDDLTVRQLDPGARVAMQGGRRFTTLDALGEWSIHTAYRLQDGKTWVHPGVFPSVAGGVVLCVHDGTGA